MIRIAHRGNIDGPNPAEENAPNYILNAIEQGFDCEVDLWKVEGGLFLGHDKPQYEINEKYLIDLSSKLWVHCKNLEALDFILQAPGLINGFWHQSDDYTLTTKGFIWTYPNKATIAGCILVHLEPWTSLVDERKLAGVCSDFF